MAPFQEYVDVNYRLILDQFFKSRKNIIIKSSRPTLQHKNNQKILYFYAKQEEYDFPVLRERNPINEYELQDERGNYRLDSAECILPGRYIESWHGIIPKKSRRYPNDEMEKLFADNRIVISGNKVSIKKYWEEEYQEVLSVWMHQKLAAIH